MQMPSSNVFSKLNTAPLRVIEVHGGALPSYVTPVFSSAPNSIVSSGPDTKEISDILSQHGHHVDIIKVNGEDVKALDSLLKPSSESEGSGSGSRLTVILHASEGGRKLGSTTLASGSGSGSLTVTPLTEFQISEYQICLWTGIVLVVLVFSTIMATATMDTNFDNILYARFLSSRSNDKRA